MSEQALDLRSAVSVLRRRARIVVATGLLGLIGGVAYVYYAPTPQSSSALVLMAKPVDSNQTPLAADTAVRIVDSASVLGNAGKTLDPVLSARRVARLVTVTAPTEDLIQVDVSSPDGPVAQKLAQAVVDSYIAYEATASRTINSRALADLNARRDSLSKSVAALEKELDAAKNRLAEEGAQTSLGRRDAQLVAQLQAEQSDTALRLDTVKGRIEDSSQPASSSSTTPPTLVQPATPPVERSPVGALLTWGPAGFMAGALLAALVVVLLARRDRRLRMRDEIADAVGSTVLVSVGSRAPRSVPAWTLLLQGYEPGPVDEFAYRQMLRSLMQNEAPGAAKGGGGRIDLPRSLTIISFADDMRGLAVGPQLASLTASLGVRTRLFLAAAQETAAAALWTACFAERKDDVRPNLIVGEVRAGEVADFNVVVAVIDRNDPQVRSALRTSAALRTSSVLLSVGAGAATAQDLARFAVALDDAGERISGIVVADPDRTDRTTGRHNVEERSKQVALPIRLTGVPAKSSFGTAGSRR